jgi:hypothetical protein
MTAYGASLLLVSGTEELKERWESHGNESKMFFTFLVGTAGAGKSLLTASLEKWLLASEMSVAIVNLDPGVEEPPYTSDVDIREYVDYGEIMHQFFAISPRFKHCPYSYRIPVINASWNVNQHPLWIASVECAEQARHTNKRTNGTGS